MPPDMIADYLRRLELRGSSPNTLKGYRSDLRAAAAVLGDLVVVDQLELDDYVAGLAARGLRAASVRRAQASLRGFFDHLKRRKARQDDPTEGFEAPKADKLVPFFFSPEQVERLLGVLDASTFAGAREAVIVKIFYYTGARASEVAALNVEDLVLDGEKPSIRLLGKGRKQRLVPVAPKLLAELRAWLAVHPAGTGPLIVTLGESPRRVDYDTVLRITKAAYRRAGLPTKGIGCHKMRHTFATGLLRRKVSIDKIQKLLGHASIDTTTRYAQTDLGDAMGDVIGDALV